MICVRHDCPFVVVDVVEVVLRAELPILTVYLGSRIVSQKIASLLSLVPSLQIIRKNGKKSN